MTLNARRYAASIATLVLLSLALSGGAAATNAPSTVSGSHASVSASPTTAGAKTTHVVRETVGSSVANARFHDFTVHYDSGNVVTDVTNASVVRVGIDRRNDEPGQHVDVNLTSDVTGVSTNSVGDTVTITLRGTHALHRGDQIVVVYRDVRNPRIAGLHSITVEVNKREDHGWAAAVISPIAGLLSRQNRQQLAASLRGLGLKSPTTYFQSHPGQAFASLRVTPSASSHSNGVATPTTTTESGSHPIFPSLPGYWLSVLAIAVIIGAYASWRWR